MRFPNAFNGVKKIWIAEIVMLLVAVMAIAIVVIPAANGVNLNADMDLTDKPYAGVMAALAIAVALGMIVAFILNLIGVIGARKDDENFKIAMYVTLLGIAAGIVNGIWGSKNATLDRWMDTLIAICNLLASYYVLTGIASLADKYPDEETKAFVLKSRTWLEWSFCLSAVLRVVINVFNIKDDSVVGIIMAVVASLAEIISYVLYLRALNKGKNMLAA